MDSTATPQPADRRIEQKKADEATIREWIAAGLKPVDVADVLGVPLHEVVNLVKPQTYTRLNKTKFLQTLRETGNITISAYTVGVHRTTVYDRMKSDPDFETAVRAAIAENTEIKEYQIDHRAFSGVLEPVFHNGRMVVYPPTHRLAGEPVMIRKYSDSLAKLRMEALKPDEYARRTKSETRAQLTFDEFLEEVEDGADAPVEDQTE